MAAEKKVRGLRGSAAKEEVPAKMRLMPGRVKAAREALKLTQKELGDAARVSQTNVSNMERGASLEGVRLVSAVRIATVLKLSLDEMVLGIPNLYVQLAQAMAEGRVSASDLVPRETATPSEPPPEGESAPRRQQKRQQRRR